MRHSGATLLLTSLLWFVPAGAHAALDLETLALTVKTEGTKGADTVFQVTLTVTGTDIASASIQQGSTTISIPCGSATSCTLTQNLTNQAALDTLLPTKATSYTITLTGTTGTPAPTVTDTFSFTRPDIPSPAISAPVDGSTVAPGALTVAFTACGTTCNATTGVLLQGTAEIETNTSLPASSTSWKPATALVEQSSYGARITHAAGGSQPQTADGPAAGTDDDSYVFASSVTHSDQVAFSTGFAAPTGDFCIVVNHDAADKIDPADCLVLDEPPAGIFDSSDSCTTTAAGIPVQYGFQLAANGRPSGIADADLDGDGSFETHTNVTGQLKGKEGRLRQKLRMNFGARGALTRFNLRIREEADLATLQGAIVPPLEWLVDQKARGKKAGAKLSESTTSVRTLPALPSDGIQCAGGVPRTGWKLSFSLPGSDGPTTGTLELANGVSVALRARQSFDSASNQSELRLESEGAERGVAIRVKKLKVAAPNQILAGSVRFRAFGQTGGVILPTTTPTTTTTTTTTTSTTTTTTLP